MMSPFNDLHFQITRREAVMKRILVLETGGTIACTVRQEEGKAPVYEAREVLQRFVPQAYKLADLTLDAPIRDERGRGVCIDSTNMTYKNTAQIAGRIYRGYTEGVEGVVVLGGTDTMEDTGADLTFYLPNKKIPVVLTGSMRPPDHPESDAPANLLNAVRFATYGMPGTYIVFRGRVISAARAKKINPTNIDAFRSINFPAIGRMVDGEFIPNQEALEPFERYRARTADRKMELRNSFRELSHVQTHYRNIRPSLLDRFFEDSYRAIIFEAPGTGGIPNHPPWKSFIPVIQKWGPRRLIGITSKAFSGQATGEYEVSAAAFKAGATSLYDMLTQTAVSKSTWLFGQIGAKERDMGKIKMLMLYPFEMEISEDRVPGEKRLTREQMEELLYPDSLS